MKNIELTLQDFGPHEKVSMRLDSPVSGIVGANGKGKSWLLRALRFAILGKLDLGKGSGQEKAIRFFGADFGAKKAVVSVEFDQGSDHVCIRRTITGTTSSRSLIINDDKPITAAAEVDTRMAEICRVPDLKVIADAAFLEQGELQSLLFGDPAEREKLFMRIFGLQYFEKVAKPCDKVRANLLTGYVDNASLRDHLLLQREEQMRECIDLRAQLQGVHDMSDALRELRRLEDSMRRLASAHANTVKASATLDSMRQQVLDLLSASGYTGDSDLAAAISHNAATSEATEKQLSTHIEGYQIADRDLGSSIQQLQSAVRYFQKRLVLDAELLHAKATLDACPPFDAATLDLLQRLEATVTRHSGDAQLLDAASESLQKYTAEEKRTSEDLELLMRRCADKENELAVIAENGTKVKTRLELLKSLREAAAKTDTSEVCCPLCGSSDGNMDYVARVLEEESSKHAQLSAQYTAAKSAIASIKADAKAKSASVQHLQATITRLGEETKRLTESAGWYAAAICESGASDAAQFAVELRSQREAASARISADRAVARAQANITACDSELQLLRLAIGNVATEADAQKLLADRESVRATTRDLLEGSRGKLEALRLRRSKLAYTLDSFYKASSDYEAAVLEARQFGTELTALSLQIPNAPTTAEDVATRITAVEEHQSRFVGLANKLEQSLAFLKSTEVKIEDIEAREREWAARKQVADELSRLKNAFDRSGVPMKFIADRFEYLCGMCNQYLARMESNFAVTVHPTIPLYFQFYRTDSDSGYVLDQNALSGGQSVRLSVAFLLSVQQLLFPEFGLLVMDEPSLHLDEEGRGQLADLLTDVGLLLQSAGSQVVVCDHSKELLPCYGTTFKLL